MCEYRFGDYCFNPIHLEPGLLARHWKEAPCCNSEEEIIKVSTRGEETFWTEVKKPAHAFLFFL